MSLLIIAATIDGTRTVDSAAIPYAAQEIVRAAEAGAAVAHVHARMDDGRLTQNVDALQRMVTRVR